MEDKEYTEQRKYQETIDKLQRAERRRIIKLQDKIIKHSMKRAKNDKK